MKRIFSFFAAAAVTASALMQTSPAIAQGAASSTKMEGQNFCTRLDSLASKYEQNINTKLSGLQDRLTTRTQKMAGNRDAFNQKLDQQRAQWKQNRSALYAKLNAKATTDAQKQAVATFKIAIDAAVQAREAAVDAARSTYRNAVDQLVNQHRTDGLQTLSAFQTSVKNAIDTAKTECASGANPATVRTELQNTLASSRSARQDGVKKIDKIGPQLEVLVRARNAAVQQAMETYRNAVKQATETLRAAFRSTTPVPSASQQQTPSAT